MNKLFAIILLLSSFLFYTAQAEDIIAGQVWEYKTRPQESDSKLTVLRVDKNENFTIISVSLDGLKIQNPYSSTGYGNEIGHIPITKEMFLKSTTKLVGATVISPSQLDGYQTWLDAYKANQGGVFTLSIAECVTVVEESINQGNVDKVE